MPNEKSYTIGELAEAAEVTVRTIRYYIGEGLLPSPDGGGRVATYHQGHLARLKLIKLLKDEFLPLHEIRALLSGLDDRAVAELLADKQTESPSSPSAPNSAKAYLQTLLQPPNSPSPTLLRHKLKAQQIREEAPPLAGGSPPPAPIPWRPENESQAEARGLAQAMPLTPLEPPAESWRRYELAPGVELHVRAGVENSTLGQRVEQLIKIARQILSSIIVC